MSDSRESKIYRHFSDHTIWDFTVSSYRRNSILKPKCLSLFSSTTYSATNVLLFSLMHFLVKPLKSWAMIDYDEMVLLQLLHTLYNTLPVYQSTMSIYARTKREIEFLLAKQLCLAYFFYGIKYHRKEIHT